jgi:hypothetical protein
VRSRSVDDTGTATAELAVALPAVALLLLTILTVSSVVIAHVRCLDAARAGARWAARGEDSADVRRVAAEGAPTASRVSVASSGTTVTVTVTARVTVPWSLGIGGGFDVVGTASAARETPP